MSKMGRKPVPEGERLTEVIGSFRTTKAEADAFYTYAIRERKSGRAVLREFCQRLMRMQSRDTFCSQNVGEPDRIM